MADLLLSYEDMIDKYKELGKDYKFPYFFQISKNDQSLYFLGVSHIYDNSEDPQAQRIIDYWEKFLQETKNCEKIVFVETRIKPVEESMDKALKKYGEVGLAVYLANQSQIPVVCPEPDYSWEIKELEKNFSREDIAYFYFARTVNQWNGFKEKPQTFEDYLNKYLQRDKEASGWDDFDFSIENMIKIHNLKHDHKFDLERCKRCVYEESHPGIGKVSSKSSTLRNEYLVRNIQQEWNDGKSVFVVYGSGHAIVCEPAIKSLLNA